VEEESFGERFIKPFFWSALCAVIIMTICSRSSFLYVFNLWDDANSYFTMGKCMFRGFVPYRDLFDQKGILLYFIYGLSSLMSATTFRGVFVMEIIAATFALMAVTKICQLFLEPTTFPYILTPLVGAVIYSSWNFYWGGSAEEFLFPFIMWGLYLSVKYFRKRYPEPMDYGTVLTGGVLAGCVLNIKFNSLGFFFAWMMMIFLADLIGERQILKAFLSCLVFLGGMVAATLPFVIYFGVHRAIDDWAYVYIYKNVFEYSQKLTFEARVAKIYDILKNHFLNNKLLYILMILGCLYFIASTISTYAYEDRHIIQKRSRFFPEISLFELLNLGALLVFLMLGIFIGGVSLPYYSFSANGFVLFGFIPICYIIEKFLKGKIERHTHGRSYEGSILESGVAVVWSLATLLLAGVAVYFLSINPKVMGLSADQLWLYKFRDYIRESGVEDPGIINEWAFDVGLYTVLDAEPICYYYQTQTLNMDEVLEVQKSYTHSGEADFIVTCDTPAEGADEFYTLVMEEDIDIYQFRHTYYLYERNREE
jgi:hypothetical protein